MTTTIKETLRRLMLEDDPQERERILNRARFEAKKQEINEDDKGEKQ